METIEALSRKSSLAGLAEIRRPSRQASFLAATDIKQELLFDRQLKEKMAIGDGIIE